jgi:hypothetical protein
LSICHGFRGMPILAGRELRRFNGH